MVDLTDEDEEVMQHQPSSFTETTTMDLARHLGQVSLDSSPVLGPREPKVQRKFSLRELEIQQTIGKLFLPSQRVSVRAKVPPAFLEVVKEDQNDY